MFDTVNLHQPTREGDSDLVGALASVVTLDHDHLAPRRGGSRGEGPREKEKSENVSVHDEEAPGFRFGPLFRSEQGLSIEPLSAR